MAVAVHGRTKVQMYSGRANWDYIRAVKEACHPVLANGVSLSRRTRFILKYTGAGLGHARPGLLRQSWLCAGPGRPGGQRPVHLPLARRCETAVRQFRLSAAQKEKHIACLEARKHYALVPQGSLAGYKGESTKSPLWRTLTASPQAYSGI